MSNMEIGKALQFHGERYDSQDCPWCGASQQRGQPHRLTTGISGGLPIVEMMCHRCGGLAQYRACIQK